MALRETGQGISSSPTSPTSSSSSPTQDGTSDQHQLFSKLLLLPGKVLGRALSLLLNRICSPCHHQSGWHSHMTALIFPAVLQEAWQGQGCLLGTIKAHLLMYLMSEALCTVSKRQN